MRAAGAGPGEAGRIRILLVDDQPNNLLALSAMLQSPDFELVQAGSGEEALRCLLQEDFALVLLDVRMPVLDGFETAALIRKRQRSKDTPIIFVTAGHASEGGHQKGYGLGAVDYIYKPIVPEVLRAKVSVFAELFRKSERLRISEEALRRELSEHKVLEEARRASEDRYRELFARASDAIVVFEAADGRIVEANKAAVVLYGWPRRELLRLNAACLSTAPESASAAWKRAGAGRAPRSMVVEQKARDGRCFPAEISYGVFSREGRNMVLAVARDITQRRKVEQAERLIEREAMQREFVSTVSHELRTPISAIKGFTETLRRGGLDDEKNRLRFVRIIESHADRLSALVDGLLAIAAFEAGKDKPEPAPIPLAAFTEQILVGLQPLAARKDLRFEVDMGDQVQVWADPGQLTRIFHNLVDNAIKYNRKGGSVRLSASASREEVQVTIDDTGMGIGPEDLPFVFEPFHRSEKARALSIGGSGLGLCIVKGIVEANGGRIWAENRPEGGAAFHFTAPLAPVAAAPAPEPSEISGLLPSTAPTDEGGSEPAVCAAATAPRSTSGSARR